MYETTYHRASSVDEAVALFGKGTLFGGPKLVKPEVVAAAAA